MTRFFPERYRTLVPYTYGEQPQDGEYVKLNTNESPFPPSPKVLSALTEKDICALRLYPAPESNTLLRALSKMLNVPENMIFVGNGSDEILAMIFMAFFMDEKEVAYPDVTYAFYPVYNDLYGQAKHLVPLKEDFTFDVDAAIRENKALVIANPNAPTGIALSLAEVERLATALPDKLIVMDEAYGDFGAESALPLLSKHDNLLVVRTLSKSRSLAGARLGFAVGSPELVAELKTIKYSFNSYTVNRMTEKVAVAALEDTDYFDGNCKKIVATRARTEERLRALGFEVLPSLANFLFATNPAISGKTLYEELKKKKVLVRWFGKPRISEYVRITIGTGAQMDVLLRAIEDILKEGVRK